MLGIQSGPVHVRSLRAYEAGLTPEEVKERFGIENAIKLSSNENPLGTSPKAIEFAQRAFEDMARYPDGGLALRRKLAALFQLRLENVIVGAGSEGIIANIVRAFLCDDDEILTTEAAFLGFQVLARSRGVPYRTVPYRNWKYDLDAIAETITDRTKLIYLANPNNPTGTFFTRGEFESFYLRVPDRVLIILDEAYFEYAVSDPLYPDSMHYRFDNVITLRTLSKAYGLAAARVGYGFAHEDLISLLLKVKLPFEPSGPSAATAIGALDDREFMRTSIESNAKGLAFLKNGLKELNITAIPSVANFVTVVLNNAEQANDLFEKLLHSGVIVRPLKATGLPNCLRISVGTDHENTALIEALKRVRSESEIDSYATTREDTDFLPIHGTDHIEFYVGNAKQSAFFYRAAMGFSLIAYQGPETGIRDRVSYVLQQDKIRFVLTTPLQGSGEIAQHIQLHGDGVRSIALWVDDAESAWAETTARGATTVQPPAAIEDSSGKATLSSIALYGDTIHTFVDRKDYRGAFLPGFMEVPQPDHVARPTGLLHIDHAVGNVGWGQMNTWVNFYERVMGFKMFKHFDDQDISTEYSALMSKVMANGNERIRFPINEPAVGRKKSQIEEYLEFYGGPGVQHIAMATYGIIDTVRKLKRQGVEFLSVPTSYYDDLTARVGKIDEPLDQLAELGVLVDRDDEGYMLQIFTKPVEDRPTLFYEIIQRKGSRSFGKGNFKALFEAIEREQAKRGNL